MAGSTGRGGGRTAGAKRKAAGTRSNGSGPSAIEVMPDVAGTDGMVDTLVGLLDQSGRRRKHLEAVRIANGHELDDPVAGMPVTRDDGTVNSYRLLLSELDDQERRLAQAFPEELEEVRRRVKARDEQRARTRAEET